MTIPKNFVEDTNYKSKENLSNQQYNLVTLESIAGYTPEGRTKRTIYNCKCFCGNNFLARGKDVKQGKIKSCGCYHKITSRELGLKNKKGQGESSLNSKYSKYKATAKRRGHLFELNKELFKEIVTKNCYYCDALPKMLSITYGGSENSRSIFNGIDRIDSKKGYIENNVVPCCWRCNAAKNDMTMNEFMVWNNKINTNLKNKGLLTSQALPNNEKEETKELICH